MALAEGEFVLTLEVKTSWHRLRLLGDHAINNQREVCLIYSDEDKLDSAGFRNRAAFQIGLELATFA
jgi:hypothetical protein